MNLAPWTFSALSAWDCDKFVPNLCLILNTKYQLTKGLGSLWPPQSFPLVALKRQKILPKRFYEIVSSHFAVKKSEIPPSTGSWCPVKSRRWGGESLRPSLYFTMEKQKNDVLVSKCFQSLYFMLFISIKPCLDVLSHPSQPHKYTYWSQKWQKPLVLTIFDNFLLYLTRHRLWRHSHVKH